jgi:BMFP domain-containing protein YqiC
MRNRELIHKKIESLESALQKLDFAAKRQDWATFSDTIISTREKLSQLKTYIETQPFSGDELNPN